MLGRGRRGGGDWDRESDCDWDCSPSVSSSRAVWAGFNLAMATTSFPPPGRAILRVASSREITRYGPVYGVVRDEWMPPRRTKTWVAVLRSSGIWT